MTPRKTAICCALLASALANPWAMAQSVIVFVPLNYPTIQSAINAVNDGAIVIVLAGTYCEHIDFKGKLIHVRSLNPADPGTVAATIIDGTVNGQKSGNVVTFDEGETNSSILSGFTIRNGYHGVRVKDASPSIRYCVIKDNDATLDGVGSRNGGGIFVGQGQASYNYAVQIENCTIQDNVAFYGGGFSFEGYANGTLISSNIIKNNRVGYYTGKCAGAYVDNTNGDPGSLLITGNTFEANNSAEGVQDRRPAILAGNITFNSNTVKDHDLPEALEPVALLNSNADSNWVIDNEAWGPQQQSRIPLSVYLGHGTSTLTNNMLEGRVHIGSLYPDNPAIVEFNVCTIVGQVKIEDYTQSVKLTNGIVWPPSGSAFVIEGQAPDPAVTHSDIKGGYPGEGNFDADPQFVLPELNDYHITCESPCRDGGQAIAIYTGPTHDVDAQTRPVGDFVDAGADEKQEAECP